ncbi:MAG: protein-glutamate O-methyltransferase CheR [Gammaproteobacteria bacterium]|nr:protein-glutamate O-methyltransferase CheR [Gammaproteobacteria bacterium]
MQQDSFSDQEFAAFQRFLEDACGIVLGQNKRYLVVSRLSRLSEKYGISSLSELIDRVDKKRDRVLREHIIEAMTTNETFWFRDVHPYEELKARILPDFAARKISQPRFWSAACSYGQEPYSISMILREYLASKPGSFTDAKILATDISPSVLKDAREGRYDAMALARGLSDERRKKFFTDDGDYCRIKPDIAKRIQFQQTNLLQSYSLLGRFDAIFCRNVLIYFSAESKTDILNRMAACLNPGGYLLLGASESISQYSDAYEMIRSGGGVLYQVKK